ncbi:PIG-L family deacetylase [Arthrobacter alpinus]|nr:PIG-L family deacetylase [Arthrobacter alpinus]
MESTTLLPGTGPKATMLFVHAHPDDETIVTGATMAAAAAAGARVVLVTCTRGELGEVIPPELAHLEVKTGDVNIPLATDPDDAGPLAEGESAPGAGLALERETSWQRRWRHWVCVSTSGWAKELRRRTADP